MSYQMPRGTQDILPKDIAKWHHLEELIRQFCYVYNYNEIRTPIFEHTEVFKRGNDSSDMVSKEMYTFQLTNSRTSLTLRPEGTAGVVRSFVEHKMYGDAELPAKLYYLGPQFRHERPQKGRQQRRAVCSPHSRRCKPPAAACRPAASTAPAHSGAPAAPSRNNGSESASG